MVMNIFEKENRGFIFDAPILQNYVFKISFKTYCDDTANINHPT